MAEQHGEGSGPPDVPHGVESVRRRRWLVRVWPRKHAKKDVVVGAGIVLDVGEPLIVTCAHVAARALRGDTYAPHAPSGWVQVDFPFLAGGSSGSTHKHPAYVAYWLPAVRGGGGDMAWLTPAAGLPNGVEPAPLRNDVPASGSKLQVFGFTMGTPSGDWAEAKLAGDNAVGWLQLDPVAAIGRRIQPGFSGAAVWSDSADGVIAMIAAADVASVVGKDDRVSYAIPARLLQDSLVDLQQQGRLAQPPPAGEVEVGASQTGRLQTALAALDVARQGVVRASVISDNPWMLRGKLPQVFKHLQAVEAAVADAPISGDQAMEIQAACTEARMAYRQVENDPSLLGRLLQALDNVRYAALGERR